MGKTIIFWSAVVQNAYYRLYVDSIFLMAKTMVIKSEASANAINTGLLELLWAVDESDPTTWKYYKNLAGQYHNYDQMMYVTSLDTLETIAFTVENLKLHTATRRLYAYGTDYYNELVSRYPSQQNLINGILNPVDINAAIAAPDSKILWIDEDLIESNEENFIPKLQQAIDGFMLRWDVPNYSLADDLYPAAQLGMLYLNLPSFISNIRLANCKTPFVHSFHVRQYLASNGRLDAYIDNLTKKQMLFLYRNILYLHRNAGKQDTFEWLTERILTERGLPLAEYDMRHNLSEQPDNLYPNIELVRNGLNSIYSGAVNDVATVAEVITKEIPLARDNILVYDEAVEATERAMKNTLINRMKTKVLESSILDRSDIDPFPLSDVLLNYWLYMAHTNRYTAFLFVDNPQTGETMQLQPKDAFILYLYAYNKQNGIELPYVPTVWASRVRKDVLPTKADLLSIVEAKYVDPEFADVALQYAPTVKDVISVDAFYDQCVELHQALQIHRELYSFCEHHVQRGQVEAMTMYLYNDVECNLADEITYAEWFEQKGIAIENMSRNEFELLTYNLYQEATGLATNRSKTLREIQTSMIRLMAQLSSYSVQFIQEINAGPVSVTDWAAIRLGDIKPNWYNQTQVDIVNARVQKMDGVPSHAVRHGSVLSSKATLVEASSDQLFKAGIGLDMKPTEAMTTYSYVASLPTVRFKVIESPAEDLNNLIINKDITDYDYPV